jgi:hypothetical protein
MKSSTAVSIVPGLSRPGIFFVKSAKLIQKTPHFSQNNPQWYAFCTLFIITNEEGHE